MLETIDLSKYYGSNDTEVKALDNVNLSINKGEFITIVGSSGSGKSTLLHMLGGLDRPSSGSVRVNDINISKLMDDELTIFRRKNVGFVFQNYNLVPILNVFENIIFPIQLDKKVPDHDFINEILELLGISNKKNNLPNQLSGGQQQRVAIARALANKPSIILADEPTGNLDSKSSEEVISLLKDASLRYNQTVLVITHDKEISELGDRKVIIEDGKIIT